MDLQKALKVVKSYLKSMRFSEKPDFDFLPGFSYFSDEELGGLTMSGADLIQFGTCLEEFESSLKLKTYSRKGLEDLLRKTILKALDKEHGLVELRDGKINKAVEWLGTELKNELVTYIISLPVMGIDASSLPLKFGHVTFLPGDERHLESLKGAIRHTRPKDHEDDNPEVAVERRETHKTIFTDMIENNFRDNAIAELKIEAGDRENAKQRASVECRRTIDVLNFYASIFDPTRHSRVALRGEGQQVLKLSRKEDQSRQMVVMGLKKDGDESDPEYLGRRITGFHFSPYTKTPLLSLQLPRLESPAAIRFGFDKISALLASDNNNTFDDCVLASIQWAGRATADNRNDEAFLLYAIALESLVLGRKNDSELTFRFMNFAAHLLCKNLEGRKHLVKQLKYLYDIRSRIVHAGEFEVTDGELREIEFYAKSACLTVLIDERFAAMKLHENLVQWFRDQLLS